MINVMKLKVRVTGVVEISIPINPTNTTEDLDCEIDTHEDEITKATKEAFMENWNDFDDYEYLEVSGEEGGKE